MQLLELRLKLELEPRVGTPTWEWHLPLDIVKKSHFPLWEASGIVGRYLTQFLTEWVILSGLFSNFCVEKPCVRVN